MIKENQRLLNQLNILSDGFIVFCSMLVAFWIRFVILRAPSGMVPLGSYVVMSLMLVPVHLITYAIFGLYGSFRKKRLHQELTLLLYANTVDLLLLITPLYVLKYMHFSRLTFGLFFLLVNLVLGTKRYCLRKILHHFRQQGYNIKHVVLVGSGIMARRYLDQVQQNKELGYQVTGYISNRSAWKDLKYLGDFSHMVKVLERFRPDEVVATLEMEEYEYLTQVIAACEKTGTKVSIIPFYAQFLPAHPQIDSLNGIPMINLRRIPLDNLGNAAMKRCMDIVGSLALIVLFSPIMLFAAIGVRLSSPGPIIFRQKRVGRNKKEFYMYKFRSMQVNAKSDVGWSTDQDPRKTRFGSFIRKFSIDELPQFFNVLKGDMSLVGPRPEIPYYVQQFKEEIPLYMVKHQVRPGITGWAQVCGLRGDTSIEDRIRHDIYYIENWTIFFDLKILFLTLFKGIVNSEKLN